MAGPGRPEPAYLLSPMPRARPPHDWLVPAERAAPSQFAVAVMDVVESIPPGRVMTYGDVADFLGAGGARAVGHVLSLHGYQLPWQRVILATGYPAPGHEREAIALLRAEGCPLVAAGDRIDLARARWDGNCPTPVLHSGL